MPYNPDVHHRRSIRLREYDYAQAGAYFVTICTQGRKSLFGEVVDGEMRLTDAGLMVASWWGDLNRRFPTVATDAFVAMPNHVHGIIIIGAHDDAVATDPSSENHTMAVGNQGDPVWSPGCAVNPVAAGPAVARRSDDLVQDHDHHRLHPRRPLVRLAAVRRPVVATQLLRPYHPHRTCA